MKLLFKTILIALFACFISTSHALKPVSINGIAPFAKGKEIRFYYYDDLLSKTKILISSTKINDTGFFSVKIPALETRELIININTTEGSFFIEPEKTYQLTLFTKEQLFNSLNATLLGNSINIRIKQSDSNELNWKINYFSQYYNYFLYKHAPAIIYLVDQSIYDSLMNIIIDKFPISDNPNDFYSVYVKFRLAEIDRIYYKKSYDKLYSKYLDSKYIYYHNPAYMDFLTAFFNNFLYSGTKYITKQILYQNINDLNNYFRLLDELGKEPMLVNEVIREIVLIQNLKSLFSYHEEFNLVNILSLLKKAGENTKFPEHKKMAENSIKQLMLLQKGTTAPDFTLKTIHNETIKLSDFKGKYIYLHFFTTDCQECIREMLIIKKLHETYSQKVVFISVLLDFETTRLYHFVNSHPEFKWKFAHFDNDFSFIDNYRVYALPLAIIFDKKGNILSYPAPDTEKMTSYFFSLFDPINQKQ